LEPKTDITYQTPSNPLDKISKEFRVSFRFNQGFYNYFMMYETIFHQACKPMDRGHIPVLYIELLDATGRVSSRIVFKDILIDGIDGLEFNFSKVEREAGTFDVSFKFNNIDYEILE
jgi:hypothetical protein